MILLADLVVATRNELEQTPRPMSFYQAITTPSNANPPGGRNQYKCCDCSWNVRTCPPERYSAAIPCHRKLPHCQQQ